MCEMCVNHSTNDTFFLLICGTKVLLFHVSLIKKSALFDIEINPVILVYYHKKSDFKISKTFSRYKPLTCYAAAIKQLFD